jgi:hypothetical protein
MMPPLHLLLAFISHRESQSMYKAPESAFCTAVYQETVPRHRPWFDAFEIFDHFACLSRDTKLIRFINPAFEQLLIGDHKAVGRASD